MWGGARRRRKQGGNERGICFVSMHASPGAGMALGHSPTPSSDLPGGRLWPPRPRCPPLPESWARRQRVSPRPTTRSHAGRGSAGTPSMARVAAGVSVVPCPRDPWHSTCRSGGQRSLPPAVSSSAAGHGAESEALNHPGRDLL